MHRLIILSVVVVLTGCSDGPSQPKTVFEARDIAAHARKEAKAARDAGNPEDAGRAADQAEEVARKAVEIIEGTAEVTDRDKAACEEAAAAAREARMFANWAEEEKRLAELTSGLKARAYRGTRKVALSAVFKSLAAAAVLAGKTDLASLPQEVQDSAKLAAELARQYAGRETLPDGQPDWKGIASDLNRFSSQPPNEMNLLGALASVLSAQNRFALYEIELVQPESLKTREQRTQYRVLRGVILSQNDMRLLAMREFEKIDALTAEGEDQQNGPELLAGIHLYLAYMYLSNSDFRQADLELVRAIKIWPNNPLSVYLTGERLAASGEYERAADSLEEMAHGTSQEWLAKRVAQRARELRDRRGEAEPLLTAPVFCATW